MLSVILSGLWLGGGGGLCWVSKQASELTGLISILVVTAGLIVVNPAVT